MNKNLEKGKLLLKQVYDKVERHKWVNKRLWVIENETKTETQTLEEELDALHRDLCDLHNAVAYLMDFGVLTEEDAKALHNKLEEVL